MGPKVLVKSLTPSTARFGCDLQPACVAATQTRQWLDLNFTIYLPSVTNEQERQEGRGVEGGGDLLIQPERITPA